MPMRPPTVRAPGARTKQQRGREQDRRRRRTQPWRAWYNTALWQARRDEQLARQPLCERCEKRGMVVAATVANHRIPHRGDWALFAEGELESACKPCHDSEIQREERRGSR